VNQAYPLLADNEEKYKQAAGRELHEMAFYFTPPTFISSGTFWHGKGTLQDV
jgi:hypothetical protein